MPKSELTLGVSYSTIDLEYEPADFDFISQRRKVRNDRVAFQTGLKRKLARSLTLLGAGGVYDGFSDYRSLWLNEYYRQYFSDVRGYEKSEPSGYNVSAGLRWEYLPASGFLQVEAIYSRANVAPGYRIEVPPPPRVGFELQRTSDTLYTTGASLSLENVLTPRVRTLHEFQIADTTDREPRFSYQGSVNWALAEHWVLRPVLGLSKEDPTFHSYSFAATLEYDWDQRWFLSLFGRFYKDNGEVGNPQLIGLGHQNSTSPPLETFQAGAGLRWQGRNCSIKIAAGPYFSRYAPTQAEIRPFEKLYRSRDWVFAQASVAYSF